MVAISFALGAVITALISKSNNFQEYVFCSNLNASDPTLHVPITNVSQLPVTPPSVYIPGMADNSVGVKHTNYYDTATSAALGGGAANSNLGAAGSRLIGKPSCEIWLGQFHPDQWYLPNPPYDLPLSRSFEFTQGLSLPVPSNYSNFTVRDTTGRPQPATGWLGLLFDTTGTIYSQLQQVSLFVYSA